MINEKPQLGFVYDVEHVRDGKVLSVDRIHNLVPTEGLNHVLNVLFKGAVANTAWNVALFEGNYTPTPAATAANIAATATECTAYNETARPGWVSGNVADGSISNTASKAVFTFNAKKTVYGGFLISDATKGGTLGTLVSVVRFPSPRFMEIGDILRITAGTNLISA